jgi:hypothetical protein
MGTPGSAGGPGKPTGSNPGRAPRSDPTHHVAIHQWGWTVALHPDGTTTARSPDGTKTFHSHSPPTTRAG